MAPDSGRNKESQWGVQRGRPSAAGENTDWRDDACSKCPSKCMRPRVQERPEPLQSEEHLLLQTVPLGTYSEELFQLHVLRLVRINPKGPRHA
eukprot:356053-Pyramimonas_sp.AAC.2